MTNDRFNSDRIHAIDTIRGLCLLGIFVNHLTIGFLHNLSPVNIMFSDAADVFIFLAGISSFIAYGPKPGECYAGRNTIKIWRRARLLFAVNSVIAVVSIVILLVGDAVAPAPTPTALPGHLIETHGAAGYLWHVLTMQQTVGYSVVLRLYVALMLVAPIYIWLASKRFWYPLLPAGVIWLSAGHFGWVESDSLSGVPLSLTILPWNLIFAAGIAFGAARAQGSTLHRGNVLTLAAAALVAAGPICATILTRISPDVLAWVDTRNDLFWTGASKTFQSPLRISYMLALTYLCVTLRDAPLIRLFHQATADSTLSRLGRSSLEVFSAGAIMALAADHFLWFLFSSNIIRANSLPAILIEMGITSAAIFAMVRVADTKSLRFAVMGPIIRDLFVRMTSPTRPPRSGSS